MKYYVNINSVYLYEGRSHDKAVDILHMAVSLMNSAEGTGTLRYANADSMGSICFIRGEEVKTDE
jgi:hypothetical protein